MNKTVVFVKYNQLRAFARKNPTLVDPGRLNKALGIAMSPKAQAEDQEYHPEDCTCGCKDWEYRSARQRKTAVGNRYTGPCKHQLAQLLMA